jgi:hypothetical protein
LQNKANPADEAGVQNKAHPLTMYASVYRSAWDFGLTVLRGGIRITAFF